MFTDAFLRIPCSVTILSKMSQANQINKENMREKKIIIEKNDAFNFCYTTHKSIAYQVEKGRWWTLVLEASQHHMLSV